MKEKGLNINEGKRRYTLTVREPPSELMREIEMLEMTRKVTGMSGSEKKESLLSI